jgi:hypothetical protein
MALDPMWAHHQDITTRHADPECTVYAFGMPADMPNWDQPRVKWIELTVCAEYDLEPIYEGDDMGPDIRVATGWSYFSYFMDDAGEMSEDWGDEDWAAARPRLRALWAKLRPDLAAGDEAYRRAVGLADNPSPVMARLLRWR